jgi:uncharacterized protein (DUF1684 family)
MSVLDFQAGKDFTAAPPAGNRLPVAVEAGEQIPYEAKAKEA